MMGQQLVLMGTFFVIPVYLQIVLGYDAFETGKKLMPLSIAMLLAAVLGPKVAARRSPRASSFVVVSGWGTQAPPGKPAQPALYEASMLLKIRWLLEGTKRGALCRADAHSSEAANTVKQPGRERPPSAAPDPGPRPERGGSLTPRLLFPVVRMARGVGPTS